MNTTTQNKINIHCIVRDVLHHIKQAVIVGLAVALLSYVATNITYQPEYTSTSTFVISAKSSSIGPYADSVKLEKLTDTFKAVMDSQVLKKMVCAEQNRDSFSGTVSVSAVEGTNLMTVGVTAGTPEDAFNLLKGLLKGYPEVGRDVLGEVVIEVFEEPVYPGSPNSMPQTKRNMMYGFVIGLGLILAARAVESYLRNTVKCREDIPEKLDTAEIATLHYERKYRNLKDFITRKPKRLLLTEPAVGFGYSENIKKIRTKLLYQMRKKNLKVILVTSTVSGEGKTTVAMNLAEAFGHRYKNVLLIEGDSRKTDLAKTLGLDEEHLCDWSDGFDNGENPKAYIRDADRYKFKVMTNLKEKRFFAESIFAEKMHYFLQDMRNEMDVIIIDGPPVQKRSDAEIWSRIADASVLVVRENTAEVKYINDAIDTLNAYNHGLLGCVYNDAIDVGGVLSSGYGYGYGSGYGYGYGRYGRYGRYGKYGKYGKYGAYDKRGMKEDEYEQR